MAYFLAMEMRPGGFYFKSLLKTMAKTADNITRPLGLKGFHSASVAERCAGFISVFYVSFIHRILGILLVWCLSPSRCQAVPPSRFVGNLYPFHRMDCH